MAKLDREGGSIATMVRSVDEHGNPFVRLLGEIDLSSVGTLQSKFDAIVDDHPERLIIDLSGLSFMDSSGLALLVGVAREIGTVELQNPSPLIRRVLEATGLSEIFRIEP